MCGCNKRFKQIFFHNNNINTVENIAVCLSVKAHFGNSAVCLNLIKAKDRADFVRHRRLNANNRYVCTRSLVSVEKCLVIKR